MPNSGKILAASSTLIPSPHTGREREEQCQIRIGIVDDQALIRTAFQALLSHQPDMEVMGTLPNGSQALALAQHCDILLMDIRMPQVDGIQATQAIKAKLNTKILILNTFREENLVLDAIQAGADGFLLKDSDPSILLKALRSLAAGEGFLDPAITPMVLRSLQRQEKPAPKSELWPSFTARESEILQLVQKGKNNREIANILGIAETTVKTHIAHLLAKTGCRNRVALAVATAHHPLG